MLSLPRAIGIALKLSEKLSTHCERIEISGSIRRARPHVGDIDLVILPKSPEDQARITSYFTTSIKWTIRTEGSQNCIYQTVLTDNTDLQVDIFFARPRVVNNDLYNPSTTLSNFGTLLLCRTGSKEHNIYLVEHAKRLGLRWKPYSGVFDQAGQCLAAEHEEDIFKALQLDYVKPELRER